LPDEFRSAANDLLKHHSPDLGDRISETEIKSKKVPTPESYTKQKLFTELRESNKDLLDKK
jgi:hypothetical protein